MEWGEPIVSLVAAVVAAAIPLAPFAALLLLLMAVRIAELLLLLMVVLGARVITTQFGILLVEAVDERLRFVELTQEVRFAGRHLVAGHRQVDFVGFEFFFFVRLLCWIGRCYGF